MRILILILAIFAGFGQWGCSGSFSWGDGAPVVGREPDSRPSMAGRVDLQRNSFEMRDQSKERVVVSVPFNARRSDVDRFRALRRAITSESRGNSSIANDLSWTAFFGMIVNRFAIDVA
jgi:hypothetical protein